MQTLTRIMEQRKESLERAAKLAEAEEGSSNAEAPVNGAFEDRAYLAMLN